MNLLSHGTCRALHLDFAIGISATKDTKNTKVFRKPNPIIFVLFVPFVVQLI